jgi:hypothetical protein
MKIEIRAPEPGDAPWILWQISDGEEIQTNIRNPTTLRRAAGSLIQLAAEIERGER